MNSYTIYRYPNAIDALDAKKEYLRTYHRYAKHCFKNIDGPGYVIFDNKTDLNAWYKEKTGQRFYDDEPEPGVKFTKDDALEEIKDRYGSLISSVLSSRDMSLPYLAIGLCNPSAFGNRIILKFTNSFGDSDIEYRFSLHYNARFIDVQGKSSEELRHWLYESLYKYFYAERFKKRIEASM